MTSYCSLINFTWRSINRFFEDDFFAATDVRSYAPADSHPIARIVPYADDRPLRGVYARHRLLRGHRLYLFVPVGSRKELYFGRLPERQQQLAAGQLFDRRMGAATLLLDVHSDRPPPSSAILRMATGGLLRQQQFCARRFDMVQSDQ